MSKVISGAATLAVLFCVAAFGNLLPNSGLTEGDKTPAGWSLSGGQGEWIRDRGDGMGCLKVSGGGEDSNAWLSSPVELLPNRVYRLTFGARGEDTGGGTVVSGPDFANVDIGVPGREWAFHHNVFAAPSRKEGLAVPVRLGQWHLKGSAFFVRPRLEEVEPVHRGIGGLLLGEGERIEASRYFFEAPFDIECRNHSRALAGFTARFNTGRWCFGPGQGVTYRHALAGRRFLSGQVEVTCGYYVSGRLQVEVSADMKEWIAVGAITNSGTQKLALPAEMFPAEAVRVRLRGAGKSCDLQIHAYGFEGDVDGTPLQAKGSTRYVVAESLLPRLRVKLLGLGDALPGGDNFAGLRVRNQTGEAFESEVRVVFARPEGEALTNSVPVSLPAGATDVRVPYEAPDVGSWEMTVELGDAFRARGGVTVPDFYDASYGERLPSGNPQMVLWRASSGWKIPRARALPRQITGGLTLRLAGNESEAVQLVVKPSEVLSNVMVKAGSLVCGKHGIPAGNVSVLRVGYVPVAQKTDSTGVVADWPDPLLPQDAPVTLEAGVNQPYWIRVEAPADLPAGIYRGEVTVEAEGVKSAVPLSVEVFGFSLPDSMTCETAFGFNPWTVWSYHSVKDPKQKRDVLDKYLRALADNHISPYNPAPMDGWSVKWKGLPQDGGEKASGKAGTKPQAFDVNAVEPVFDWSAWDAAMERAFAEYHFNSFQMRIEGLGGGTFHGRHEPKFLGYDGGTPEYEILMGKYLGGIESHLREKGWLDKAYVYWFDEPDPKDYEFVMRGFETLKRHAPGLRRMLTEQVEEGLAGGPNLWCPLTPSLHVDGLEERRAAGDQFWWYVCCGPKAPYATLFIDHPGTEMRVWLWQTWAERVTGILVWETVYWTSDAAYPDRSAPQNPYLDPMSWVSGYSAPTGMKSAWGNGDGRFLYPPLAAADGRRSQTPVLAGPVSSFRIEMLRDGLEDYEYFVILKRLLEQKGGKMGGRDRSRMEALLKVPAEVSTSLTSFTRDPAPIEEHRERLARAIAALQRL